MSLIDALLYVVAGLGGLSALLNIFGAAWYDFGQVAQKRQRQLHPYDRSNRRRPAVSIIVIAHNNQNAIIDCLSSLLRNKYRKLDIVVADNASADETRRQVRQFIAKHPRQKLKLYSKRQPGQRRQLLNVALKRCQGELIMVIDGNQTIDASGIIKAVQHFNAAPGLDLLAPNTKFRPTYQAAALFQEFKLLLLARTRKASSTYRTLSPDGAAYIGTRDALLQLLSDNSFQPSLTYAHDLIVYSDPLPLRNLIQQTYLNQIKTIKSWFKQPRPLSVTGSLWPWFGLLRSLTSDLVGLAVPILLTYFVYLALRLHEPAYLVISWVALSLFMVFAIWEDEQLSVLAKLRYFVLMPFTYSWFYLMAIVRYMALLTSFSSRVDLEL